MRNCMLAQGYNGFDLLFSSPYAIRARDIEHSKVQYITAYRPKRAIR